VHDAADALAARVLAANSDYADAKIAVLKAQIESSKAEIKAIDNRYNAVISAIAAGNASSLEQQVMISAATLSEQRRGTVLAALQQDQLLLAQARTVELGKIVGQPVAVKTAARSRKNGLIVGGALGLIVGAIAALMLPGLRRRARA
jgi:hypothetical protein